MLWMPKWNGNHDFLFNFLIIMKFQCFYCESIFLSMICFVWFVFCSWYFHRICLHDGKFKAKSECVSANLTFVRKTLNTLSYYSNHKFLKSNHDNFFPICIWSDEKVVILIFLGVFVVSKIRRHTILKRRLSFDELIRLRKFNKRINHECCRHNKVGVKTAL